MAGSQITFSQKVSQDLAQHELYTSNLQSSRLMQHKDGILYIWSELKKCLYTKLFYGITNERTQSVENESTRFQTLVCSIPPYFEVTDIKINPSGQHLLLFGTRGVGFVELPRRWGEAGLFEGGKDILHCRLALLDDSFFCHHVSIKILEAAWYPGSLNNKIIVLTNENCLRFYDISSPNKLILRFPLFGVLHHNVGTATSNISSALGDDAVDFDVGESVCDKRGVVTNSIFVLQETGDVWTVYGKFTHNRLQVYEEGPLIINPPSLDNYGCNYCSLICLPSVPTTVVIGTQSGSIYHCLLLQEDRNGFEDEDSALFDNQTVEQLFVYESVELEQNFLYPVEDDNVQPQSKAKSQKLQLTSSGYNDRYLAVTKGGVHSIFLPWLHDIDRLLLKDQYGSEQCIPDSPADVSYVLCTQPFDKSPTGSIYGCAIVYNDLKVPCIVCLMTSGEFLYISLASSPIHKDEDESTQTTGIYTSPIRSLHYAGNFDTHIRQILSKDSIVPRIRCGGSEDSVPIDAYYRLLTKTTKILREEYIQKLLLAKIQLENRCKILTAKKEQQKEEVEILQNDVALSSSSEELGSKLEMVQENTLSIGKRVNELFRKMLFLSPVISNEESVWSKELTVLHEKLIHQRRCIETVKRKHENIILQEIPESSINKNVSVNDKTALSASQNIKVRAVLKEQGNIISKLVEDVQSLNVQMGS
ncbi:nucleoporin 88-like [Hydractinia symbiolongicarpus]|uniref:nucleoporin 88-like n=1 Tax=Hydractinia symbiolongicarpus TaxID=13093 RepID=UPI002551A70C|nr:nucleoporin 88-like [Hydractinia symbiolongicarpus]